MDPLQYQIEQYRRFTKDDKPFGSGVYLGGSSGSGGGSGAPPGGFIGQLPQSRVCFDTSQLEISTGSSSLVDNLNHIRKRIYDLEMTSGSAAEGFYNTIQDDGVARPQRGTMNLVDGSGVSVVVADDSPNQRTNITPALDINGLIEELDPETSDYLPIYSSGNNRKVSISNLPFSSGSFDEDAVHVNVANEISGIAEKATPADADIIIIEDSADSYSKKRVQIGNLPSSGSGGSSTFLGLTDTPASYSGQAGMYVVVNEGEDALEFSSGSPSSGSSYIARFSGVRAFHDTDQTIPNNSWASVLLNSENYDTDSYHSEVSDTAVCTVPRDGYYHITGNVAISDDIAGDEWVQVGLWRNDSTEFITDLRQRPTESGMSVFNISTDFYLDQNQNVRMKVFQSSGSDITIAGGNAYTFLAVHLIGVDQAVLSGGGGIQADGDSYAEFMGARVSLSSAQSVSTETWTAVSFGTEQYDVGDCWTSGSATRLTAPVDGFYHITGNARWDTNLTGVRGARIVLNGITYIAERILPNTGNNECTYGVSTDYYLGEGDYIELLVYHERESASLSLLDGVQGTFFSISLSGVQGE